jgi:hypothetical protein
VQANDEPFAAMQLNPGGSAARSLSPFFLHNTKGQSAFSLSSSQCINICQTLFWLYNCMVRRTWCQWSDDEGHGHDEQSSLGEVAVGALDLVVFHGVLVTLKRSITTPPTPWPVVSTQNVFL